jgi:hypothetical protein
MVIGQEENMATFYELQKKVVNESVGEYKRILEQAEKAGFSGDLKIYDIGMDFEDSISLVIEGVYDGEPCCVAVGYGMNRYNLAIRTKWYRHAPPKPAG